MHPQVDIARTQTPTRSIATTGSHSTSPLARTLLNLDSPMRLTTLPTLLAGLTILAAPCVGEVGGSRKPGPRDPATTTTAADDATCAKVEKDVIIRNAADMTALPKIGCYDIYGKLTLQGSAVTSLA